MTYEQFREAYVATFKQMMAYKPSEVGSQVFAEKMADMSDEFPEFAERCESDETI
jgi:hypothetical protein